MANMACTCPTGLHLHGVRIIPVISMIGAYLQVPLLRCKQRLVATGMDASEPWYTLHDTGAYYFLDSRTMLRIPPSTSGSMTMASR